MKQLIFNFVYHKTNDGVVQFQLNAFNAIITKISWSNRTILITKKQMNNKIHIWSEWTFQQPALNSLFTNFEHRLCVCVHTAHCTLSMVSNYKVHVLSLSQYKHFRWGRVWLVAIWSQIERNEVVSSKIYTFLVLRSGCEECSPTVRTWTLTNMNYGRRRKKLIRPGGQIWKLLIFPSAHRTRAHNIL